MIWSWGRVKRTCASATACDCKWLTVADVRGWKAGGRRALCLKNVRSADSSACAAAHVAGVGSPPYKSSAISGTPYVLPGSLTYTTRTQYVQYEDSSKLSVRRSPVKLSRDMKPTHKQHSLSKRCISKRCTNCFARSVVPV